MRGYAGSFGDAQKRLKKVDEAEWTGTAALNFRRAVRHLPDTLAKAETEFEKAANALKAYAATLRSAQNKAKPLIDEAADARAASKSYRLRVNDYNAAVEREDAALPPRPPETDPGGKAMEDCIRRLDALRGNVDEAARKAKKSLEAAAEAAPDEPGILGRAWEKGRDFLQGAYEATDGLVDLASAIAMPWRDESRMQLAQTIDGIAYGVEHPKEFVKASLNWDMWKEQPFRAAGQLMPDLALTLVSGGGGAAAKAPKNLLNGAKNRPGRKPGSGRADTDDKPDQVCQPNKDKTCETDPVDVVTGDMTTTTTDLSLPGSLPLVLERTHISSYRAGGWFGPSWAATLDQHLELDERGVVFAGADGILLAYPVPAPGAEVFPERGPRRPLTWDGAADGALRVTDPHTGHTCVFAPRPGHPPAAGLPLTAIEDRAGRRIDFLYDEHGTPVEIRHHGGYRIAVDTHETLARITGLRLLDPDSPDSPGTTVVAYGYDEVGNLTEVTNSSGLPLHYTYDAEDRITSWTDRNGSAYAYAYDHRGRVLRTVGPDGFLFSRFRYDEEARTTVFTNSLGHETTYRYNAAYKVVSKTDPLGHTTLTEYDPANRHITAVTDPLGHTTRYTRDEVGNVTSVQLPDGSRATAAYNALNLPVEVAEPGGAVWRHTYDERGNLLSTTDPVGAETRYAYDGSGHLTAVTDALGHTRRVAVNAPGLPVVTTDPLGHTTAVERDAFGRVTAVTDPLGHTTRMGWTIEGKPTWREAPDGSRESWEWDGEGNLLAHTDQAGHTTRHTHTHFDLPASRTDPDGHRYDFAYDTELRLTTVTNPQGLTWTYAYDPAGRLTAETDFNGRTLTYTHDAAGRLATRTNGAGETLAHTRDLLGRTVRRQASDGETTVFAYDTAGRLASLRNSAAEVLFEHDLLDRLLSETVNGRTTRYTYDALGRRTSRTTPGGITSTWTWDAAGRPAGLHTEAGQLDFAYDAAGREVSRRLGPEAVLEQTWDAADRLTTQTVTASPTAPTDRAGQLLQHRTYAYRPDGYLTEIRDLTSGTRRFDLTPTGRITAVTGHGWSETYAYDSLGNITHVQAPDHPSPGDREFTGTLIRRAGRTRYVHDAQGRLIRKNRKLLNGQRLTWTFTWNAEDRLTAATTPTGEIWHYAYDPLGRRISKRRLANDGADSERIDFTWDGTRLAEQITGGAVTTWEYTPGTHRPLAQLNNCITQGDHDARFHAIVTDLVGTPIEFITSEGDFFPIRRTSPWGKPTKSALAEQICPIYFPGQYQDTETGLSYNLYRYYDPENSNFITADPLGLAPSENHHSYTKNPLHWLDPTGLESCERERLGNHPGGWDPGDMPRESMDVIGEIEEWGVHPFSRANGGIAGPEIPENFRNGGRNGGHQLPEFDESGRRIRYQEWGTIPSAGNPKPGNERIVTGSDGSIYYTPTHYQTWIRYK
ncbi:putative T7SS-secreted protein [Streptomyces thermolineatus]|uniref:putative T7SS-secreted protein n=1 Tax=Streptomyces thermolineatus TaxID=44033 RepID=UPI0031E27D5A